MNLGASTFTSNITGGGACSGDVITFNCTQDPLNSFLRWVIIDRSDETVSTAQFTLPPAQPPVVEQTLSGNEVSGTAAITSYSPSTTVVSTLTITVTRQLDGYVVECAGTTPASLQNTTINIASMILINSLQNSSSIDWCNPLPGLPSPPQNVMVTIVQNGTTTVTVNIDWDPPVNSSGGAAVDSYTVETSPETDPVRVTSGTTATLDLSYNERYAVNVTAVNCVGSSTPALTDPVEFGMLFLPKSSTLLAIVFFLQLVAHYCPIPM